MTLKGLKLNSIRVKLIASLIGLCIVPLLVTSFGSYGQSKGLLNKKLSTTSSQLVEEVNHGIDDYIKEYKDLVTLTASNYDFTDVESGINFSYVPGVLKSTKEANKDILGMYYGTDSGKFTIYPEAKMPDGYDARQRDWYKQAIEKRGQVIITLPYKDSATGDSVITIAKAVEKDGKIVGVVGLDCSLNTLGEKIADKKIGDTGYVYIVDPTGNIIAHPKKERINTPSTTFDLVKNKERDFLDYSVDGQHRFGAYTLNKETGWKIVGTMQEEELTKDTNALLVAAAIAVGIVSVLAVVLSLILSKGIANNIKKMQGVFAKASEGDLTVRMESITKDEFEQLSDSFNHMLESISGFMNEVSKSSNTVLETSTDIAAMSEEVTASIGEVARAIEEVSNGATNQAKSAQDGVYQVTELSDKLDIIGNSTDEMHKLSSSTQELSSKGLHMIETLTDKSNKTKLSTNEVSEIVKDMNESTKQINAISQTISNITDQTNLLSLNASIESARAGEAGRGFAVVADEIRKLAEQSKHSTEEIKAIVTNIQNKSNTAVNAIEATKNIVSEQEVAVAETQAIFTDILESIKSTINKVEEVKLLVVDIDKNKQSTVVEIESISAVSEETASASEEVTASAEEITATMTELSQHTEKLHGLAEKLEAEIKKFKTK